MSANRERRRRTSATLGCNAASATNTRDIPPPPELAIEDVRRTEGLLKLLPEVHEGARRATAKLEFGTRSGQSERGG